MSGESGTSETGEELVRSLADKGVEYVFANFGTDHPPLVRALAEVESDENLMAVISPHEMVAASAAHGYAQVTGDPQAVLVHVDVGTANLGASVHNASRCRVPMMLLAGRSPITTEGELPGTRNLYVHYYQDVYDQHSIVREYTKWEYELKTGANVDGVVARGLDVATTSPRAPVYLTMPREILRSETERPSPSDRSPVRPQQAATALDEATRNELATLVEEADSPLLITTYYGRDEAAVPTLVEFAETAGVPVVEAYPVFDMNFPRTHDLHLGFEPWDHFDEADLIFTVNCDVPWIPSEKTPREDATIVQIDVDTTKPHLPYWDFPTDVRIETDPATVLSELTTAIEPTDAITDRVERFARKHQRLRDSLGERVPSPGSTDRITPELLSATVSDVIDPEDVVVDETVTNTVNVLRYVDRSEPGTYYAPCSSGLGWATGASLGIKLARPDDRVVTLVGDGAFVFGNPLASIQMARAYDLPHVNVVYNNSGWEAVNLSVEGQYGDAPFDYEQFAAFDPPMTFAGVASGLGCHGERVSDPEELAPALRRCLDAADAGTHAVLDVELAQEGGY